MTANYSPPLDQLLTLDRPEIDARAQQYPDTITTADVPELIRMATDEALLNSEEEPDFWAPIHAWRLLGRLGGEAAIAPLLQVLDRWGNDETWWEWAIEDLPTGFAQIGPIAIPAVAAYLEDTTHEDETRQTSITILTEIAEAHEETRADVIAVLTRQLEKFNENSLTLNGFLVTALASDLEAVESAPVIEQAYQAGRVDEQFIGDWDDAQVYLGLKERKFPRFDDDFFTYVETPVETSSFGSISGTKAAKAKAKQKAQKEARRKNRKKKKKK